MGVTRDSRLLNDELERKMENDKDCFEQPIPEPQDAEKYLRFKWCLLIGETGIT
jgi:hypothetical protein